MMEGNLIFYYTVFKLLKANIFNKIFSKPLRNLKYLYFCINLY